MELAPGATVEGEKEHWIPKDCGAEQVILQNSILSRETRIARFTGWKMLIGARTAPAPMDCSGLKEIRRMRFCAPILATVICSAAWGLPQ